MKSANVLITIVAAMAVMGGAASLLASKPAPIMVQGEVEATRIDVASKLAGRVKAVHVVRGEQVVKGALVFEIDSPEVRAKMSQARAAVSAATSQRNKANKGARVEEVQAANNLWNKAKAGLDLAQKTHARIKTLTDEGILPAQKLDEAEAALEAARETAKAAGSSYAMAKKGARVEDKESAQALVDRAEGALSEVEAFEDETKLYAPRSAEVSDIVVDPGELAPTGCPVVTLIDLNDVWVTFNLKEELLAQVRMGDMLTARIPALGDREVPLQINYIAPLGAFATWHATKATGDFDMKTFEVRAVPKGAVEGLRPGMSALVTWKGSEVKG